MGENVKAYYGEELKSTADLKTSACCTIDALPSRVREVLPYIAEEIKERYYGCGSPIPPVLEGLHVLDLGCGTGRDSYVLSKLVGEEGFVYGLDFTESQIETARKYRSSQAERFGYNQSNVDFIHDAIENVGSYFSDNSLDLIISNCVLNLLPEKSKVFAEIFRILKPGGELYFSDVFSGSRIPGGLMNDPVLHGECLAGAMYAEDFRRMLAELGCPDYRVVEKRKISLDNPEIEKKIGMIDFYSLTVRAFKLENLEDICEDYGQTAVYLGTVPGQPHRFALDDYHTFPTGKPVLVCGNTAAMLAETRLAPHFRVSGDRSVHYGPFDCSPVAHGEKETPGNSSGGCC
ncbi:MAG: methyltransferase domain-containing protein [Desulfurivibrionaceae bacterium]